MGGTSWCPLPCVLLPELATRRVLLSMDAGIHGVDLELLRRAQAQPEGETCRLQAEAELETLGISGDIWGGSAESEAIEQYFYGVSSSYSHLVTRSGATAYGRSLSRGTYLQVQLY